MLAVVYFYTRLPEKVFKACDFEIESVHMHTCMHACMQIQVYVCALKFEEKENRIEKQKHAVSVRACVREDENMMFSADTG